MELKANVNFDRFEGALQVVDSHTVGEFCRIVIGGFPEPEGTTMIEKKKWMEDNYDHVRTALMFEPRGHHDMFGAFLCEPVNKEADFGVMFMDTGGYLNMCGHCTIGAVTVAVEAGENQKITVDGKEIEFTISFGGSFFALVDTTKLDIGEINPKTVPEYTKLGMKMLEIINRDIPVKHPLLDITSVDLVEFYGPTPNPEKATMRNVVIFGDAMADRSPCGTGTSAKLATLHHWGEIKVGEEFIYESFIGSLFKGVIKETAKVGDFDAVIPMITGSCYLTGVATYLIDPTDPLKYGFQVG